MIAKGKSSARSKGSRPNWIPKNLTAPKRSVETAGKEFRWFIDATRMRERRSMFEFAEQEIILPNGPYEGGRFRTRYQPYSAHWFHAVDSGKWNRHAAVGPVQSGKTLSCYVIPALYHLFEIGETVVVGLPSMDIAKDKWREDFVPTLELTRYRDLMPDRGEGSRGGGAVQAVKFKNGATLRFMSGGGSDKKRSAFTSRVILITEVDGMDEAGSSSREADKVKQIEARAKAFGRRKRVYLECTASIETGKIWQEFTNGTQSRIVSPCVHCGEFVLPEREQFAGAADAANEFEATEKGAFHCPACAKPYSDSERIGMVGQSVLIHDGQEIEEVNGIPKIVGEAKQTDTLGFRWSAFHNLFLETPDIASDVYNAGQDEDEQNGEKQVCQQLFAIPYVPPIWDDIPLTVARVIKKSVEVPRGVCPPETEFLAMGIDMGKYRFHWSAIACGKFGFHVVDYGQVSVPVDELGIERSIVVSLRDFRDDYVSNGWKSSDGGLIVPQMIGVDSGWQAGSVYKFTNESAGYVPVKGWGSTERDSKHYPQPRKRTKEIILIGDGYHVSRLRGIQTVDLVHINSDVWKTRVQAALALDLDVDGRLSLFSDGGDRKQHFQFARHLTSEKRVEEFEPGKGTVIKWVAERRANHWFDTVYTAVMLGSFLMLRKSKSAGTRPRPVQETAASVGGERRLPFG